ncbi:MAG: class I SAM-dependent methyltransferase [Candidatus Omnitrophota bacterium]
MIKPVQQCRICGNKNLVSILNLGEQVLTGVFPRTLGEHITRGPLELVKCADEGADTCGLVQLKHSYDLGEMYGKNYGYRSGLNRSMVQHLKNRVAKILSLVSLHSGDLIIDIGSNDSTLLQAYPKEDLQLVGIDPTGIKFKKYYPKHVRLIADFFSAEKVKEHFPRQPARVVSSISMFYDLEAPVDFMRQVYDVLAEDGIWVFEQSYMPEMLKKNSYDTICHEHLEYYGLKQIKWMTDKVGFKIIDLEFNEANGGSFAVTVAKRSNKSFPEAKAAIEKTLAQERARGLATLRPYEEFKKQVYRHKKELGDLIKDIKSRGQKIFGYGASTKGNVILQFCGLSAGDIPCIAEVNQDKFGCYTPGSGIPIISEADAKAQRPDYFLVLPWHFRGNILEREKEYLKAGGNLIMPLPEISIDTYKTLSGGQGG